MSEDDNGKVEHRYDFIAPEAGKDVCDRRINTVDVTPYEVLHQ